MSYTHAHTHKDVFKKTIAFLQRCVKDVQVKECLLIHITETHKISPFKEQLTHRRNSAMAIFTGKPACTPIKELGLLCSLTVFCLKHMFNKYPIWLM